MKNKQHKYILKAFLESRIPAKIRQNAPELIAIDSIIGGCCTQLLKQSKFIEFPADTIISKDDKKVFSELINQSAGVERDELVDILSSCNTCRINTDSVSAMNPTGKHMRIAKTAEMQKSVQRITVFAK